MEKTISAEVIQEIADTTTQSAPPDNHSGLLKLNSELIRGSHVCICIPCYNGQVSESTFLSFINFSNTASKLGIKYSVQTLTNESLISRARNTLTAKFLSNTDYTHLMFIDSDIGWEGWHLLLLINHDLDIVGGLYPAKTLPIKWVVNSITPSTGPADLVEVSKAGTGFLLVKRHVFESLKKHPDIKNYHNDIGLDSALDNHMYNFFDTSVRNQRYYSEDWTFCDNWRQLGGKIYIDKRILLTHTGYYNFNLASHVQLVDDYGKMYLKLRQGLDQPLVENAADRI